MATSKPDIVTRTRGQASSDALSVLLEASASLLSSPNLSSVLPQILKLASSVIAADAYAVWRMGEENRWKILASEGLSDQCASEVEVTQPDLSQLLSGPYFIKDVLSDSRVQNRKAVLERESIRSMLVLPLTIRNTSSGTIVLYFRQQKDISEVQLRYAAALANLAAAAISTAEVYEQQIAERRRFGYLAEISKILSSSLDYQQTLQRVADLTVPEIADGCNVYMIDGKRLRSLAFAVADRAKREIAERLSRDHAEPLRDDVGGGKLLRIGRPVLFPEAPKEMIRQFCSNDQEYELMQKLGIVSAISVPMYARGRGIGVLRLVTAESGRRFTERDLNLADEIANRAAIAIDNARLHKEQRENEERYKFLTEALPLHVWFGERGEVEYCNRHFLDFLGMTIEQVRAGEAVKRIHPDDLPRVVQRSKESFATGLAFREEYRGLCADGTYRWLLAESRPFRDLQGRTKWLGTAIDITERKLAEQELRVSNERLSLALDTAKMGDWEWDMKNNVVTWSDAVCVMHGIAPGEYDGTYESWFASVHPDDRGATVKALERALASGHYEVEYRTLRSDGSEYWTLARGVVRRDADGSPERLLGVCMDISSRKLAEEALLKSEKLAATGRMAATIAHEINNPLEAVTNLVFLAEHHPEAPSTVREALAEADQQLRHVAHIVRQTLGFYRENAAPRSTTVREIVNAVGELYGRKLSAKGVELSVEVPEGIRIDVVPGEMRQVMANLLANAIDAAPMGGKVTISARIDAGMVNLSFFDSGPGVDPKHESQLFQPFFTSKKDVGTGLGLWVSREIVEKHHGRIEYRRWPEVSLTEFLVLLPEGREGS